MPCLLASDEFARRLSAIEQFTICGNERGHGRVNGLRQRYLVDGVHSELVGQ